MQTLLVILLSLAALYLFGLMTIVTVSVLILRQKLRKFQEGGRFGY